MNSFYASLLVLVRNVKRMIAVRRLRYAVKMMPSDDKVAVLLALAAMRELQGCANDETAALNQMIKG